MSEALASETPRHWLFYVKVAIVLFASGCSAQLGYV